MSSFSLADLCDLADVTPRTVRYYVAQGLLRAPSGSGPATRYDEGHLYRLRLIRRLQREHLPLVEVRRRLDALSDGDVERLADEPGPATDSAADYVARVLRSRGIGSIREASVPPVPPLGARDLPAPAPTLRAAASPDLAPPAPPSEPAPIVGPARSQWERIVLAPEIELHVRRPLSRHQNRRVDRLLETARSIFTEDDE